MSKPKYRYIHRVEKEFPAFQP